MGKKPIEWHEECLKDSTDTERRLREELDSLKEEVERICEENAFKTYQILLAKSMGKTEFDGEKFGIKRFGGDYSLPQGFKIEDLERCDRAIRRRANKEKSE